MKTYTKFRFTIYDEAMIALLFTLPFESFEELENGAIGYIATEDCTQEVMEDINAFAEMFSASFTFEAIPDQNWNALWESNFSAVEVGRFCRIRADFHEDKANLFEHQITINPKMAFGTGHHQTTYMMIDAMAHIDFKNKLVLDYGCGTGILAILASKLGCKAVDAVDIEKESYLNTIENCQVNHVNNVNSYEGTIDVVNTSKYSIILANINRNVLLETADQLFSLLSESNATLLLSGILKEDIAAINDRYSALSLKLYNTMTRDNWACLHYTI